VIPDHPDKGNPAHPVNQIAAAVGGTVNEMKVLPDGSGFATMSFPLPKTHWSYQTDADGFTGPPPMPFQMGTGETAVVQVFPAGSWPDRGHRLTRQEFAEKIREAGKYAYRASTMCGKEPDLDPDALLQNLIVGLLGYWTATGLSSDEWANPKKENQ
jgi:hypothetical protein